MPHVHIGGNCALYYELDHFGEPWRTPETILLIHGIGGSSAEWYAWVPPLCEQYSVLRVDLRGCGKSTGAESDRAWSMGELASDIVALLDGLGIERAHVVGAKLGGRIALHMGLNHPERLHTMTLISTPMTLKTLPNDSRENRPSLEAGQVGVAEWARQSMNIRLGNVDPAMREWWIELYSRAPIDVVSGLYDLAWWTDETALLGRQRTPTLVLDSTAVRGADDIRRWQELLPGSKLQLVPVPAGGRHIAATQPAVCAALLREFLAENPVTGSEAGLEIRHIGETT